MTDLPRIPRYDLVEEVGSGGMSVVYRAHDTTLDREVAVKVLHRHLAGRESERARFRQEAQAVARLSHPHILEIHDYSGEDTADAWIVSEFIRGPTLRGFAETTGFGLPTIGALVAERLARALTHAHGIGIIHRDLKPENVMVQDDGTIKLTDFGIARMVDRDTRMTTTGTLLGSPAHMAPEIIEGKGCDERSDIFSLGTVLYYLTCGSLPFRGDSPAEVLRKILQGELEDPRQIDPRVTDPLAAIVHKAMALDPEDRYQSAEEMAEALAAHLLELGLERPEDEVKAFFAEPAEYKEQLRERLIAAWLSRAEEAVLRKKIPEAISACDAVLGLDANNERATLLLAKMRRRRDRLRALSALGATLLLAVSAGAVVVYWPAPGPSTEGGTAAPAETTAPPAADPAGAAVTATAAPSDPTPTPPTDPAPAPAPGDPAAPTATGAPVLAMGADPAPSPARDPRPARPNRAVVRREPRPVRIQVEPYGDIFVDDTFVDRNLVATKDLIPGAHQLKIVREGFVTIDEQLMVLPGTDTQRVARRLEPKPATLQIANVQEGVLSIGEKLIGPIGGGAREVPVTFPARADGSFELDLTLDLKVEKPGFDPHTETVRVRPGQVLPVVVSLEPAA